jgi:hypothetical protein
MLNRHVYDTTSNVSERMYYQQPAPSEQQRSREMERRAQRMADRVYGKR